MGGHLVYAQSKFQGFRIDGKREERKEVNLYAKEEVQNFELIHFCSSLVIPMVFCWSSGDANITRIEKSMPGQISNWPSLRLMTFTNEF